LTRLETDRQTKSTKKKPNKKTKQTKNKKTQQKGNDGSIMLFWKFTKDWLVVFIESKMINLGVTHHYEK